MIELSRTGDSRIRCVREMGLTAALDPLSLFSSGGCFFRGKMRIELARGVEKGSKASEVRESRGVIETGDIEAGIFVEDRCRRGEKSVMGMLRWDIALDDRRETNGFSSVCEEEIETLSVSVGVPGTNPRSRVVLRSVYIDGIFDDCVRLRLNIVELKINTIIMVFNLTLIQRLDEKRSTNEWI